jgi:enamine deaminase RidA (YjgF/YER057c/UK114 family)
MKCNARKWTPDSDGAVEYFFVVEGDDTGDFDQQISRVFEAYETRLFELGLDFSSGRTATFFLSDSANQEDALRRHPRFVRLRDAQIAVSLVQQPPVGAKLALSAYHVVGASGTTTRTPVEIPGTKPGANGLAVATESYGFFYLKNLLADVDGGAAEQTTKMLGVPGSGAQCHDLRLSEVVRTWIYINDIDTNYIAVSNARNRVFEHFGITRDTGFPASTGIQGRSSAAKDIVLLDVLAIRGLQPGQSRAMHAPGFMNSTTEYGVAFERGREVVFGDRRHLFVSGTASINDRGEILHPGDVVRQTERAITNIAALLDRSGARPEHLQYIYVYLRDAADAGAVTAVLAGSALADIPRIMVNAPVCRPGWLVEIEGLAVDNRGESRFARF